VAAVIASDGAVLRRKERSLGLVKLGVGAASGIGSKVLAGAGLAVAKPLALGLLGKCKCYNSKYSLN
jgi:hypothetical protein